MLRLIFGGWVVVVIGAENDNDFIRCGSGVTAGEIGGEFGILKTHCLFGLSKPLPPLVVLALLPPNSDDIGNATAPQDEVGEFVSIPGRFPAGAHVVAKGGQSFGGGDGVPGTAAAVGSVNELL